LLRRTVLARFDGKNWKVFAKADGLADEQLSAIARWQGALWLVYRDSVGISRMQFDGERHAITHFTMQNGLSSNQAIAVCQRYIGEYLGYTDNGIDVNERGHWRHYGLDDGLIWEDTNGGALHADTKATYGLELPRDSRGMRRRRMRFPILRPQPFLTSVRESRRSSVLEKQPVLPYSRSSLLIRFSSLNYANQARTRFHYRLRGYEDTWNETGERNLHFAGLPAGHYVF